MIPYEKKNGPPSVEDLQTLTKSEHMKFPRWSFPLCISSCGCSKPMNPYSYLFPLTLWHVRKITWFLTMHFGQFLLVFWAFTVCLFSSCFLEPWRLETNLHVSGSKCSHFISTGGPYGKYCMSWNFAILSYSTWYTPVCFNWLCFTEVIVMTSKNWNGCWDT